MASEVVYVDALPYFDQGYDEPGVREAVYLFAFFCWASITFSESFTMEWQPGGQESDPIEVLAGVKQGCVLAWMLFSVRMDGQLVAPLAIFRACVRVIRYT